MPNEKRPRCVAGGAEIGRRQKRDDKDHLQSGALPHMGEPHDMEAVQHHAHALVRSRYRLIQHLSETLYGVVFLCEDTKLPPPPSFVSPHSVEADAPYEITAAEHGCSDTGSNATRNLVVLKQVGIAYAMKLLDRPLPDQHMINDPRQGQAMANLLRRTGGHPKIVKYLDSFVEGKTLFFVMEYCADSDLYEYLHSGGKTTLTAFDAMSVLAHVGAGVAFLHPHGVAHRDISLENVLLADGVCKLGDFGLSARATELRTERVGKAYYMAPEVVASSAPYDARAADTWSLGIMLFILLMGSPLVSVASAGDETFAALERVGVKAVLKSWGVTLSRHITQLLEWMLAIYPAQRLTIARVLRHSAFDEWDANVAAGNESEGNGDYDEDRDESDAIMRIGTA